MSWSTSIDCKGLKVYIDDSGLIGFYLGNEKYSDPETIEAVHKNDSRVIDALNLMIGEFTEISLVNNVEEYGVEYYTKGKLPFSSLENLERIERDLYLILDSKYAKSQIKADATEWLQKIKKLKEKLIKSQQSVNGPGGYIYFILAETGHYKIGRTKNLKQRMDYFGVKLPFDFKIVHTFPADNIYEAESLLHQIFASQRVSGEWFTLQKDDIEKLSRVKRYQDREFLYY